MTQSHRRSPSSTHYPSKPKSSRPVLHRRGTSSVNLSISKLGSGHSHSTSNSHSRSHSRSKEDESEFDMASFLNFCAMCERQITVPNNTLLYCSEGLLQTSLRLNALNAHDNNPINPTSLTTPLPRTIVAPMTPTRVQSNPPHSRIPSTTPTTTGSDLDPTEWKPVINAATSGNFTSTSTPNPISTTAWSYLSQFHGPDHHNHRQPTRRPMTSRNSVSSLPGLGFTTGTGTSIGGAPSLSSSVSSSASDYLGSYEHRPLPPRHKPSFSGTYAKGVQLVVPHVSSVPGVRVEMVDGDSDSGSIFPASSSVWEDEVKVRPGAISIGARS
ncbi:hypothetical protein N7509_009972 [Penicillium cosmopolitanum]|uniref:Uncharacterized protein n=1 Tax=Penicillium cosmopolitanum TaxID=1131564 RepID=A0A9W9VQG2_9EURO|nr:uncharacterized protein N7509_009972 [Penicillium cosmopolitanum]KAJ5387431.1 hypothetical protein N7509_009972 [Penicillium cosmopolitanum]